MLCGSNNGGGSDYSDSSRVQTGTNNYKSLSIYIFYWSICQSNI